MCVHVHVGQMGAGQGWWDNAAAAEGKCLIGSAFARAHARSDGMYMWGKLTLYVFVGLWAWFGRWCMDLAADVTHITEVCLRYACGMPAH